MRSSHWFLKTTLLEELFTFVLMVPPFVIILYQSFHLADAGAGLFWGLVGGGGTAAFLIGLVVRLHGTRKSRAFSTGKLPEEEHGAARRELANLPVLDAGVMLFRWLVVVNALVLIPYGILGVLTSGLVLFTVGISILNGLISALVSYFAVTERTVTLRAAPAIQNTPFSDGWIHRDKIRTKTFLTVLLTALYPTGVLCLLVVLANFSAAHIEVTSMEIITLTITTLVVVILNGKALARNIKYSLHRVRDALEELKQGGGDLTYRAPSVSYDTSGLLAASFNEFLERLSTLIGGIQEAGTHLQSSGGRLQARLSESAQDVEEISSNVEKVAGRVHEQDERLQRSAAALEEIIGSLGEFSGLTEEQSTGVNESSSAVTEMIGNVRSVTENVHKLGESMSNLTEATTSGVRKAQTMNEQVAHIAEESETLQEANRLIRGIAAQTNLLAMNAAIEAAHAGEAGRGFSVVAEEIRTLAESASTQSKRIAQQLKEITRIIDAVVAASQEVQGGFSQVQSFLETASRIEAEVRQSMDEQSAGSQQTLKALTHITEITDQIREESGRIAERAGSVGQDVRDVVNQNGEIAQGVDFVHGGVERVSAMVQELSDLGSANEQDISRVLDGVNRFRTQKA